MLGEECERESELVPECLVFLCHWLLQLEHGMRLLVIVLILAFIWFSISHFTRLWNCCFHLHSILSNAIGSEVRAGFGMRLWSNGTPTQHSWIRINCSGFGYIHSIKSKTSTKFCYWKLQNVFITPLSWSGVARLLKMNNTQVFRRDTLQALVAREEAMGSLGHNSSVYVFSLLLRGNIFSLPPSFLLSRNFFYFFPSTPFPSFISE